MEEKGWRSSTLLLKKLLVLPPGFEPGTIASKATMISVSPREQFANDTRAIAQIQCVCSILLFEVNESEIIRALRKSEIQCDYA
ncbi:MAG: hypothetical protein UY39_C0020G0002 [Candidatus Kaiserbacteria bacterium GW2011_GWC2_49_12]|uniref:Uncharacterized protein n=2 Tax=Candidatus Kaiseribacteriota TaxID=1752734 RepID=A0A0G1VKL9_9BACT|nr:MAG: hypothetical protein UY39_C0020G0002 [Candidatus Kaiserbacteria bacterium GW2011_GWC2_49_12]